MERERGTDNPTAGVPPGHHNPRFLPAARDAPGLIDATSTVELCANRGGGCSRRRARDARFGGAPGLQVASVILRP
jgi:hypothetical protein